MAFIVLDDMMQPLKLPKPLYKKLIHHLYAVFPEEGCGVLRGTNEIVTGLYPIENIHHSPTVYELNPKQQIAAFLDAEALEEEIVAIFHSHPTSPAFPSETDIKQAFYPNLVYLIVSLIEFKAPVINGFRIDNGEVTVVAVEIV